MKGVILRPAKPEDMGFVFTTWVESLRGETMPGARPKPWREAIERDVASRMRKGRLVVACDEDDADRLYGFAAGKPGRLWYVFVRDTRRRFGLGSALAAEACGVTYTAAVMTPTMMPVAARHGVEWKR